jgi:hypothetical protein
MKIEKLALKNLRNEEQSEKTPLKMKNIRKELDDCYVEMVKRIEAVTILQSNHRLSTN